MAMTPAPTTKRGASTVDLDYLRRDTLGGLATLVGVVGLLGMWYVVWPRVGGRRLAWSWLAIMALPMLSGLLAYLTRDRWPRSASILLVLTCWLTVLLAAFSAQEPQLGYLFPLVVVLSSVLLNQTWILIASGLSLVGELALMAVLGASSSGPLAAKLPLLLLIATAIVSYLGARTLHTALEWFEQSYLEAQQQSSEVQLRRGELRRTLHALEEATGRVQRTNDELKAARQVAEQERTSKEQFVATVSHELRTPLNLVVGFAEMLYLSPEIYAGVGWTPELVSDIGEMYRAGRHLQNLVNDILDLSRIDARRLPMHRVLLDLRDVIQETMDTVLPLFRQKRLEWWLDLPDEPATVLADPVRMQQVMINLLNNAVRFTDKGQVGVRLEVQEEHFRVSVVDTGLGIPADQIEGVFQSFTQVNGGRHGRGGAGLGLAISQQLVQRHGGEMGVESEPGKGSSFLFSIPRSTTWSDGTLRQVPATKQRLNAPIVLVEQDNEVADLLGRQLGGHKMILAEDEAQAEALVEREHPCAIIVNVPPGRPESVWAGPLGAISQRFGVPVVRCSIPSSKWLSQATELDDCLPKPITREVLAGLMARHAADRGHPISVLVVDDNAGFANLVMRLLSSLEDVSQVFVAHTGLDALEIAAREVPDLMLLDIVMPEMNGFEVLERLKADPDLMGITVVALTSTSYSEELVVHNVGCWTLTHSSGLSVDSTLDLLEVALRVARPDYLQDESSEDSD